MNDTFAVIDFESYYDSDTSVATMGPRAYAASPHSDIYLVGVAIADSNSHVLKSYVGPPSQFDWRLIDGMDWVSHNASFDQALYEHLVNQGKVALVRPRAWYCSANASMYHCLRRSLAEAHVHLFGRRLEKTIRDRMRGVDWHHLSKEEQVTVMEYCRLDAHLTAKLWNVVAPHWPQPERELSALTIRQALGGVRVDVARIKEYLVILQDALIKARRVIPWATPVVDSESEETQETQEGLPPISPRAFAHQCEREGIPIPVKKTHDAAAYLEWEEEHIHIPWVRAVAAYRIINLTAKTLSKILQRTVGNRFYFDLMYFGAHTGRWAGGGGVNMQNLRKTPLLINQEGLLEVVKPQIRAAIEQHAATGQWPDWVKHVIDIRSLFMPEEGHKFVIADLAQIEPRVLAWAAGQRGLLARMEKGESIYQAYAESALGWPADKNLKTENPRMYALVKAQVLGLGYGCGTAKFVQLAKGLAGIDLTVDAPEHDKWAVARTLIRNYRQRNIEVVQFWNKMQGVLERSVGKDLTIPLPSWRALRYKNVSKEVSFNRMVYRGWVGSRHMYLYGGKLVENYVQAVARDIFAEGLLRCDKIPGVRSVWTTHDEAIYEVPASEAKEAAHQIAAASTKSPEWASIPLGMDYSITDHYCK